MGSYGINFKFTCFIIIIFLFSCSNKDVVESLNNLDYEEAFQRLENNTVNWKYALWNNKIYYESKLSSPISSDSLLKLIKSDTTFSLRKLERFYRELRFIHPKVIKQLLEIENSKNKVVRSYYYSDQLLKLLKHSDSELNTFAINSYYYHNHYSNSKTHIKEMKRLIDRDIRESYKDSIKSLISILKMEQESNIGIFHLYKQNKIPITSETQMIYQFILTGMEHSSYNSLALSLRRDDLTNEYKHALISTFKHNDNDSLLFVLNNVEYDLTKLKLIQKIHSYSNEALLVYILDLFKNIEQNQRILEGVVLKWNITELKRVITNNLLASDPTKTIHLVYFIGKKKFVEFSEQVKKLTSHSNKLVKFEAIRTLKRLK